jgi:UDP-N-acetylglucosamine transferase subunit ALG13
MILVLLGTQNNSFHRLLEEIDRNIENGNITEEVIVQAGFTKYKSQNMKIFDMVPQEKLAELVNQADLIITHGGVGSMMLGIKAGKKVIAIPRLKKYGEHVNDHQLEIIDTFKKQGVIVGLNDVSELGQALKNIKNIELVNNLEHGENQIIKIIDDFIKNDGKN